MVTSVPVDMSYEFPHTELEAMSDNIDKLIQDIDKLDGHRRNMMEELKVLRDITLFNHERHPELRAAGSTRRPAEDTIEASTRQHDTRANTNEPRQERWHPINATLRTRQGQRRNNPIILTTGDP